MISGLVSTIIPVYNRPQLLREAVNSVLAQTYRPIEVLIVDDGSTDDTGAVGESLAASHPDEVRYVRKVHDGIGPTINAGIRRMRGEFVQFLDSDDLLMPEKFAMQVDGLRSHPDCDISYCYAREYASGDPPPHSPARRTAETFATLFPHLLEGKLWPAPVPLYRRSLIDATGLFLERPIYQEWEYDCRAAALGVRLQHCPMFLAEVRGMHRVEGRIKGSVPPNKIPDYVFILERILEHGRRAQVPASTVNVFSRRLFEAARLCAAAGFETEARHCLALAASASSMTRRQQISIYAFASTHLGWQRAGRWSTGFARSAFMTLIRQARRRPVAAVALWRHRARAAYQLIHDERVTAWPSVLAHGWRNRRSRQQARGSSA